VNYEYYLFDWDGCLAKTLEIWLNAYRQALKEYGAKPSDQEIAYHFGDWEAPRYFGIDDVQGCVKKVVELANQNLREVELYPGAKELLEELAQTKKIALLSSSERQVLEWGLKHNGLTYLFDVVISGDEVENHKPHPEVIEKGLAALNATKELSVMIGDSRKDLEASSNAGIDSVLVYPESHKLFYDLDQLKLYKPIRLVHSFEELKDLISK
jgi:pyrophosphatase PpaX